MHPFDHPSPLAHLLAGDGESGVALALRSSTRALPLLTIGIGLGAAALVDAVGHRRPRWGLLAAGLVVLVALGNLPSLLGHRLVDPALARDEQPPQAWDDAAAALDAMPAGYRVLQLPGAEFGAYRWGYTVDPPLPGLTTRPLVTRDLLPLGSAAAMDLLYALDDRFQEGWPETESIAPIARLLGADTVWVAGDMAFDRFRTPRPEATERAVRRGRRRSLERPRRPGGLRRPGRQPAAGADGRRAGVVGPDGAHAGRPGRAGAGARPGAGRARRRRRDAGVGQRRRPGRPRRRPD